MFETVINCLSQISKEDYKSFISILESARQEERRIWSCGNGGSCSLCVHFTADLENLGLDTKCLCCNQARITALANDVGWENVYVEQMKYFKEGDILIVASVHGGVGMDRAGAWSQNLVKACQLAKDNKGLVLGLIGGDGGVVKDIADASIIVPHDSAYIVEGVHSVLTHLICAELRRRLP